MYLSLLLVCCTAVFIRERLILSVSFSTDDLDSLPLLFDDSASSSLSLFNDDDEFSTTTTAATLPNSCAAVGFLDDDLSLSQDETNLLSRRRDSSAAECLPPVNIGADTLQLFEAPWDSLENAVMPLKGQIPDDDPPPPPAGYPGLLSDGEGDYNPEDLEEAGYRPYQGAVRVEVPPESSTCAGLTFLRGLFTWELCCDGAYYAREAASEFDREALKQVDWWTRWNQDAAVIKFCICTFF